MKKLSPAERLTIAAAFERLTDEKATPATEDAQLIIDAFKELKAFGGVGFSHKSTKTGSSVEGLTEHGNASYDQGKETTQFSFGFYLERVGKWVVERRMIGKTFRFWQKHYVLQFRHFLDQDIENDAYKLYFLEHDSNFAPVAFGYYELRAYADWGWLRICREIPKVMHGETTLPCGNWVITQR